MQQPPADRDSVHDNAVGAVVVNDVEAAVVADYLRVEFRHGYMRKRDFAAFVTSYGNAPPSGEREHIPLIPGAAGGKYEQHALRQRVLNVVYSNEVAVAYHPGHHGTLIIHKPVGAAAFLVRCLVLNDPDVVPINEAPVLAGYQVRRQHDVVALVAAEIHAVLSELIKLYGARRRAAIKYRHLGTPDALGCRLPGEPGGPFKILHYLTSMMCRAVFRLSGVYLPGI